MNFALDRSPEKPRGDGMGGHHSAHMETDEWLTPPHVLAALGAPDAFDLDPAACLLQPNRAAIRGFTVADNGLARPWIGRVWLNPPYGRECGEWLARLADHGDGIALIFARTETRDFHRHVWRRARAILFLEGRLTFLRGNGIPGLCNAGAPSCLIAYGETCAKILLACKLPGHFVALANTQAHPCALP